MTFKLGDRVINGKKRTGTVVAVDREGSYSIRVDWDGDDDDFDVFTAAGAFYTDDRPNAELDLVVVPAATVGTTETLLYVSNDATGNMKTMCFIIREA